MIKMSLFSQIFLKKITPNWYYIFFIVVKVVPPSPGPTPCTFPTREYLFFLQANNKISVFFFYDTSTF